LFNYFVLVKVTDTVYAHNDTTGVNKTGINDTVCQELFGYAAEATKDGGYCRCANDSVAFWNNNTCCMFQTQMIFRF